MTQDNSARDSKRNNKERKTEKEVGRLNIKDWTGLDLVHLAEQLKIQYG